MKKIAFTLVELLVVISIIGFLIGLLLPPPTTKETPRRAVCQKNLTQIGKALQNYHDTYKVFPPAYVADADGNPLYSWRVLILPFLEYKPLYEQFRLDEPWDSEANQKLLEQCPEVYRCKSASPERGETSYVMIVGSGAISDGPHSVSLKEITDKHSQTILVTETLKKIPWSAPIDVPLESLEKSVDRLGGGIGSNHSGTVNAVFVDGSVKTLSYYLIKPETFRALATIDGGETIELP